jgi:G3E family GTPase
MSDSHLDMWILGGFLGSGKTTVLNALLRDAATRNQRVGVLVNDFGEVNIDATLVRGAEADDIVELNGGQIFCACLSGSFVKAIGAVADRGVDLLLVESSGLAKPAPLTDIVEAAVEASGGRIRYRGFISVIDAPRFGKLEYVVNAVTEQVVYADIVVINKVDLADASTVKAVTERVRTLNPGAAVLTRERGALSLQELDEAVGDHPPVGPGVRAENDSGVAQRFVDWGSPGRPVAVSRRLPADLTVESLRKVIEAVAPLTYRIKGYAAASGTLWFVSAAGEEINIDRAEASPARTTGLTVIAAADINIDRVLDDALRAPEGERERAL